MHILEQGQPVNLYWTAKVFYQKWIQPIPHLSSTIIKKLQCWTVNYRLKSLPKRCQIIKSNGLNKYITFKKKKIKTDWTFDIVYAINFINEKSRWVENVNIFSSCFHNVFDNIYLKTQMLIYFKKTENAKENAYYFWYENEGTVWKYAHNIYLKKISLQSERYEDEHCQIIGLSWKSGNNVNNLKSFHVS